MNLLFEDFQKKKCHTLRPAEAFESPFSEARAHKTHAQKGEPQAADGGDYAWWLYMISLPEIQNNDE